MFMTDFAAIYLDRVRAAVAPEDRVLDQARSRRNLVTRSARSFAGALRTFNSGSLAHGDASVTAGADGSAAGYTSRRS
jgi:hypothetical protein